LATYHLRDALQNDRVVLDTAMNVIFYPLLKSIDLELFQHIVGRGVGDIKKLGSFLMSGISNWFATDIYDIATASRIIDVFLVSHPTTPIYFVIAILIEYRSSIMSSSSLTSSNHTMYDTLRQTPLFQPMDDNAGGSMNDSLVLIEQIISRTLTFM
jgi:hypothetical protein